MRNVTFSADERLIDLARHKAEQEHTTLNERFREWLTDYVNKGAGPQYRRLMKDLGHVRAGRKFSRDELNER